MTTPRIIVQAQEFVTRVVARGLRGERGQGVIPGGAQGQILGKLSDDDYDTGWINPGSAPSLVNSVAATAPITSTGGVNPVIGIDPATASASGSMSADDKAKLDNLLLSSAPPPVAASSQAGASARAAREDHTHAHGAQGGGTLHTVATGGVGGSAGFMSVADKNKLDGIQAGAQVNVATNLGIGGSGNARTVTSSTGGSATLPIATQINAGVMSVEDKAKLDGISPGATVYTNALARGQVEAMLIAGSNVTFSYAGSGASRTLTINATISGGGGSGTVTSVGLSLPSGVFDVTGSPVTASGTLAGSLKAQAESTVFAGPASGADAAPTFRALVPGDIPLLSVGSITGAAAQRLFGIGEFAPGDSTGTSIALGTGFAFAGNTLNLSSNLQGWHALDPASRVQSVNTRTGAVALTDADVPADVLEWNTTTKTAALTDRGVYVYATATGAKTYEFTTTAGGAAGEYHIRNDAASGDVTLTATGVTLKAPKGGTLVLEPGDTVTVKRVASNVFHVFGSTKAS